MARWRGLWHLPSLCVGGVRGRRARRPSAQQANSPRSQQSHSCQRAGPRLPPLPAARRPRHSRHLPPRLALPVGPCETPTGRRRRSHSESQWELRKVPGTCRKSHWAKSSPTGGAKRGSGSCKARLEKRVGAARRPSPGPTRTSHWEARHYRARATSSGVPSLSQLNSTRNAESLGLSPKLTADRIFRGQLPGIAWRLD